MKIKKISSQKVIVTNDNKCFVINSLPNGFRINMLIVSEKARL